LAFNAGFVEQYKYEVLLFDESRGRQLVAAVEIVSPANKDRDESRHALVAKCAELLRRRVCVSIVDVVTTRHANLYTQLLDLIGQSDPAFSAVPSPTYAVTCRPVELSGTPQLEIWAYPLIVGQQFPMLPVWLSEELAVPLDLETSYEAACRVLRIG
jgi:hypothetical protein